MLWVRFVSKATVMTLAAKHQLGEKVNANVNMGVSWSQIVADLPTSCPDLVEAETMSVRESAKQLPNGSRELPAPGANAGEAMPAPSTSSDASRSRNGDSYE